MKLRALFFVVVACVCFSPHRAAIAQGIPCSYEVAHVIQAPDGPFGSSPTGATAISPNGRYVCGWFNPGGIGFDRAFVFDTDVQQFMILPLLADTYTNFATDVNDAGQVTGHIGGVGVAWGFVYDLLAGQYTLLPSGYPGGTCWATGINDSGTVCGYRAIAGPPDDPTTAFLWNAKDGFTDLGLIDGMSSGASDIADDGQASVYQGVGLQAYVWDRAQVTNIGFFQGADGITPNAIADGQHVVGGSLFISGATSWAVAFEYRAGSLRALPTLNEQFGSCTAIGVSNAGLIVGGCRRIGGQANWRPCTWLGGVIRDLNSSVEPSEFSLDFAIAATDGGVLLCGGENAAGEVVSLVLTPIFGVPGDADCNQIVDIDDLLTVIQWWGPGASLGDLNGDQIVNVFDLLIVIDNWTF